jgi:hypothetical protein
VETSVDKLFFAYQSTRLHTTGGSMMQRNIIFITLAIVFLAGSGFAGKARKVEWSNKQLSQPAPLRMDPGIQRQSVIPPNVGQPVSDNATSITWVAVDQMANAFGPASNRVQPLVFDPGTGALALIHRGAAPYGQSGQLWYNVSHDGGVTWRRVGEISQGQTPNLRYPSLILRNPRGLNDTTQVWVAYAAPNLRNPAGGGSFGSITYGVDLFGENVGTSFFDDGPGNAYDFSANLSIWNATGSATDTTIFWATRRGGTANEWYLWRTGDYTTLSSGTPPTWQNANFTNAFSYIGGQYWNGKAFFNVISIFVPDTFQGVFNYGYSISNDRGATWSGWTRPQPDWAAASGAGYGYDLLSYYRGTGNFASFQVEAVVDANERMHYFSVVCDSPWTLQSRRSIMEVFQTPTGWSYKVIAQDLNVNTGLMYPGPTLTDADVLDQTYNALRPSISRDRQLMTLVWLDAASTTSSDTLPDIWFSWRRIDGANWSTPLNLTQTPGFQEILLHAAPLLRFNGGNSYTLFLSRSYQTGLTTYPPNNTLPTTIFVGSHTFTAGSSDVPDPEGLPGSYTLSQNYPNPFNPATRIDYTVTKAGPVSIKVFNTLGQEVRTLVDGPVSPGQHSVSFDASALPSGVYIYRMQARQTEGGQAGSFVESKKMVFLK